MCNYTSKMVHVQHLNEAVEKEILMFYKEQKWQDIVNLDCTLSELDKSRLFWVLPTTNDLHWIKEVIDEYNLVGLISIGCGCGLFEWLFQKYSGFDVIGIELDHSWWRSKYSPPLFLENMIFVHESDTKISLPNNYALLFCYFNNGPAFWNYIENYKGNLVFIIGPKDGENRWTDPMPFDQKFNEYGWKLISYKYLERTNDCIAVYRK
ncbi:uncharacterized protein LOC114873100 [Osmia bicornis bicornis]|uniref:uncharacterized protein LOC114873100 n=1 Tax=Osmia bicornis bicornis TaxID=1437191 RepID=UPI0010F5FED1|nr:uncharacterized protein LOC114873100 [Osmia bicornis bicornis]